MIVLREALFLFTIPHPRLFVALHKKCAVPRASCSFCCRSSSFFRPHPGFQPTFSSSNSVNGNLHILSRTNRLPKSSKGSPFGPPIFTASLNTIRAQMQACPSSPPYCLLPLPLLTMQQRHHRTNRNAPRPLSALGLSTYRMRMNAFAHLSLSEFRRTRLGLARSNRPMLLRNSHLTIDASSLSFPPPNSGGVDWRQKG